MPKRILTGKVTSSKSDKTITVLVERKIMHPMYKKFVTKSKKFAAHDNENKFKVGADLVIIPPARFINNIPPTTGNIIKLPKYNILPNAKIPALLTSLKFRDSPIGR